MKLSKLYCNKPFHNITFITYKGGINVILGDIKNKYTESKSHNLGKSKLAELLDFMLLRGDAGFFFYRNECKTKFINYEFYLEILLNNGKYLTIKRNVDNPTKIYFKEHDATTSEYTLYDNFPPPLAFEKAKKHLNDLLNFDFCKENQEIYRRLLGYSLRLQGDYEPKNNTIFQLSKFMNINNKDSWKALIFSLLGFNGGLLIKKYDLENRIKEGNKTIKAQEKDFGIKVGDKDLLVGQIQNAEAEKETLAKELENFNFYQQDKETIENLVGSIENEIAILNTQLYQLEYDIKKLNESIKNEFSFDLNRVKSLFEEVELYFPEQLSHSYAQLIEFNHLITKERNAQIYLTLQEKINEQKTLQIQLFNTNKQKEQFRELIQDTSLFKKYAVYQKKLVEIEKELFRFQAQLEAIEELEKKKEILDDTQRNELQTVKDELKEILDNTAKCTLYMSIRKSFSDIVKRILHENALITIKPNANYNIEFKPEFPDSAKDDGATYYKVLCIAFDLAVLINYREKSHFRFVYHDDVVAGDDNGVKDRLITVVREICEKYDIQYLFSAIKDNLPPTQNVENDIILRLNDESEEGKLFKMSF